MSRNQPSTVGAVIARLRRMLGHVGKKDREAVLEAIEAIDELSTRLFEATHVEKKPKPSAGLVTIQREPVPLEYVAPAGAVPDGYDVLDVTAAPILDAARESSS